MYVVCTLNNCLNETATLSTHKHMSRLMGKNINNFMLKKCVYLGL